MTDLSYHELGSGPTVILIHGFPMNQQVWTDFAEKLSESFLVVTLDLPGFGKSLSLPEGFTIEDVAAEVSSFIRKRNYLAPVIVGHSLGGYVGLAVAGQTPDLIKGLCLFHSTALADSEEKKQSRDKVIDFIEKQGVRAFTSNFIGPLYADPQHSSVTRVKEIAAQSSKEAVVGYTKAMRNRKDTRNVIEAFRAPILFLAGKKDPGIPPDTIEEQASLSDMAEATILPEVAHMGMFESPAACLKKIHEFILKCEVTFSGDPG